MNSYRKATNYVCDTVEDMIVDGKLNMPATTFAECVLQYSKGIQFKPIDASLPPAMSKSFYFHVEEYTSIYLSGLAEQIDEFYDYCIELCAHNVSLNAPLPIPLRLLTARMLRGEIKRPSKRKRPRKKTWIERNIIWSITLDVLDRFELKLTKDPDTSDRDSACHAVAEGLSVCGRETSYDEIKRLMIHPENARLRLEFQAAMRIAERWQNRQVPVNALSEDYQNFWRAAALEDARDILTTFPKGAGENS